MECADCTCPKEGWLIAAIHWSSTAEWKAYVALYASTESCMLPYSIVAIIEINVAIDSRAEMATMASCCDNILRGLDDPNKIGEVEKIITDFYNEMTRGGFKCGLETMIIHLLDTSSIPRH